MPTLNSRGEGRRGAGVPRRVRQALLGALAMSAMCLCTEAHGRDMTGKGGIGLLQSTHQLTSRLPTLTFRYWTGRSSVEVLLGFDWRVDTGTTRVEYTDGSTALLSDLAVPTTGVRGTTPLRVDNRRVYAGFGLHRLVYGNNRTSVTIGARGVAQLSTTCTDDRLDARGNAKSTCDGATTNALALLAELPLQVEFFLTDHSAITCGVALTATISQQLSATSADDAGLTDLLGAAATGRGGVEFELGGRYSGGLGYTYYF